MKLESVFHDVYGYGVFQIILSILCAMNGVITMFDLHLNSFMLYEPENITCNTEYDVHWISKDDYLAILSNNTVNLDVLPSVKQCYGLLRDNSTFKCSSWTYPHYMMNDSLIMEYDLICDRSYIKTGLSVNYLVGIPVGMILAMQSDRFGRRNIFLCLMCLQIITNILIPFVKNIEILFVVMFFRAMSGCLNYMGMTQIVELLPIKKRSMFVNLYWAGWSTGNVLCPLVAYWLRNWRQVKYTAIILSASNLFLFYLFPKSPRWHLLHGREKEAFDTIQRIAKFNRPNLPENYFEELQGNLTAMKKEIRTEQQHESLLDGFRNKLIGTRLIVFAFCHTTIIFCYFGLLQSISFMSNNIFLNGFLAGVVEYPGTIIPWFMSEWFGRRTSCLTMMVACGTLVIITPFLTSKPILKAIVGMLGKMTLFCSYGLADLYIAELMPTSIRTSGCFFGMMVGAIASIITPLANSYLENHIAIVVYGAGVIIGGTLIFISMPETKGHPMPDTIADSQGFSKGNEKEWALDKKNALDMKTDIKTNL